MGNKAIKIVAFLGVLGLIYFGLSWTNTLRFFKMSSTANEPTLLLNSRITSSNIPSPKIGDFVCYSEGIGVFDTVFKIHRLVALPNDTIEIINGKVFLNGNNSDLKRTLYFNYLVNEKQYELIKSKISEDIRPVDLYGETNEYYVFCEQSVAIEHGLIRQKDSMGQIDLAIQEMYNKPWNKDHFGPLVIPEGKCFVMGDNRDYSYDSRHGGLVDVSAIVGVLIWN